MIKYRKTNKDYKCKNAEMMKKNWLKSEFIKKLTEERQGFKNPNWRGGKWKKKSAFLNKIRNLKEYLDWKNKILERDIITYPKIPKGLQVHHLKSLQRIIHENNVESIDDARKCKELWDIKNGCVMTSGEHLIITWLNRKKRVSFGFYLYLNFFLEEFKGKYYDWCR